MSKRYSLLLLVFLAFTGSPHLYAKTVENIRIWAAPDSTRVVLDANSHLEYSKRVLTDPHRIILTVHASQSPRRFTLKPSANDLFLQGIHTEESSSRTMRVVLTLKRPVHTKIFQLQPHQQYGHRLVVDLLHPQGKEEAIVTPSVAGSGSKSTHKPTQKRDRDVIIAIDAGHGGEDPGAIGKHGSYEKDVVLKLAKKLASKINQRVGMRAVLIRSGDYFISLRGRINKARKAEADLFISLHADAFHDHRVQGSSVYVLSQRGASSENARWLAERENLADMMGGVNPENESNDYLLSTLLDLQQTASLQASEAVAQHVLRSLAGIGKVHQKKVQSAGFVVLKSPDIPSILVEVAFISNPSEEKKLLDSAYQKKVVNALVNSLHRYYQEYTIPGTLLAQQYKQRYIIRRGDTLSGIAKQYQISPEQLRMHNDIKGDFLRVGQVITIPRLGSSRTW